MSAKRERAEVAATQICVAAFCARGNVRSSNEDNMSIDGSLLSHEKLHETFLPTDTDHLLLVADGMGGHAKGEVASQLAVASLSAVWRDTRPNFDAIEAAKHANRRLYDEMARDSSLRGMGATVVGLHIHGTEGAWFNVGDSRSYHFRSGCLRQLSQDHVPRGDTSPGRGRSHRITQSIGGGYAHVEVWPAMGRLELQPRDRVLLCSDGLSDAVPDEQIAAALRGGPSLLEAAAQLRERAFAAGAPDNITLLLIELCG